MVKPKFHGRNSRLGKRANTFYKPKTGLSDRTIEEYSNKILPLIEYSIDENGNLTVFNDTAVWYRYIDMTAQAESLYSFIEVTIDKTLKEELDFLANYDKTKKAIQDTVDMPDKIIDLLIRFCLQNNGQLSERKYKDFIFFTYYF